MFFHQIFWDDIFERGSWKIVFKTKLKFSVEAAYGNAFIFIQINIGILPQRKNIKGKTHHHHRHPLWFLMLHLGKKNQIQYHLQVSSTIETTTTFLKSLLQSDASLSFNSPALMSSLFSTLSAHISPAQPVSLWYRSKLHCSHKKSPPPSVFHKWSSPYSAEKKGQIALTI